MTSASEKAPVAQVMAALVKARRECPATVHKSAQNQHQGYKYAGHEQVLLGGARDALLRNGLALVEEGVEFLGSESGGKANVWRWRGTFSLVHESGEVYPRPLVYEATTMANDKAAFVASTALDRTAHMRLLQIAGSNEENPEHDSHDRGSRQEARQEQPAYDPNALADLLEVELPQCKTRADLVRWVHACVAVHGRPRDTPAWRKFGDRCAALEVVPREVLAEARGGKAA